MRIGAGFIQYRHDDGSQAIRRIRRGRSHRSSPSPAGQGCFVQAGGGSAGRPIPSPPVLPKGRTGWSQPSGALALLMLLLVASLTACGVVIDPTPTPVPTTAPVPTPDGYSRIPVAATPAPMLAPPEAAAHPTPVPVGTGTSPPQEPLPVMQIPNVADTVERVRPAVVSVVAEVVGQSVFGAIRSYGSGTGVIFDSHGLVLTNNHVVEGASQVVVTLDDGTQVRAEIVGADRLSELAVLRLPEGEYPYVPLRANVPLRVGEWVIAIGNALALPGGPTVTVGVVSGLGRALTIRRDVTLYDLIQTDAVVNPGNSGGPLLNLRGELVGINTAVQRYSDTGVRVEGMSFAISMETADLVTGQLVESGKVRWAWMGVFLGDLDPEVAARVGLPVRAGVVIQDLFPGGPSAEAGILPGDIVLSIGGKDVATVSDLTRLLRQEFIAGQTVTVDVFRDGNTFTLSLTMGERPQ